MAHLPLELRMKICMLVARGEKIEKKTLKKQLLYSPTLYHKYTNEDLEDLINCIGEARVNNKFYL